MKLCLPLLFLCLALSPDSRAESAASRTWTSTTGQSFEGSLTSASEDSATVRRSDGKTFDVPLTKLSEADQTFVRQYLTDLSRAEGLSNGPFADKITGEWVKVPKEGQGLVYQIFGSSKLKRLKEPFPLFVHLHGAGARAEDVETGKIEIAPERLSKEELYDDFPCLIVVPLCPPDTSWGDHTSTLEKLIDTLTNSLPIDRNRIYLSGYSMGARGIGSLIESRPNFYAAALFADGEAKESWVDTVDTALWFTFSGERDLAGAEKVANAYTSAGKIAHFEGFPDHTHNQIHWTLAKTEGVYEWCFSQVRK
ncbi:hypothetical protein VSU19_13550 [Verrucomicrobiales bacterium BCK34]|nr:hypothetical protein [Verrucomicrobiales bacterium BCK34]